MRIALALALLATTACGSVNPSPVSGSPLNVTQLKFAVMDVVGRPVYCDPDFYPIAREGGEQASAISTYPQMKADAETYAAIVAHEHLPSADLTDAQKLVVYRAWKLLRALDLTQGGSGYSFQYRIQPMTDVRVGQVVWTQTADGRRIAEPAIEVGSMPVPPGHLMVHLVLADGRELLASPGHRTADGRALGDLQKGDALDGSAVTSWELVAYSGERTYDLLPAGATGRYWADGILLSSTLRR
ncbi:MAG: hypothetical protein AUI15_05155 [Actinobacteria bacterium 13_2_20CM_2_66_6]|nr:MAG: hypothetical protein AUI15_05155 [Actinobacteria bacterium 13_2_20CM_2_66_6]